MANREAQLNSVKPCTFYGYVIVVAASFGFTVGVSLGPYLTGYIFDVTESYKLAFLACAIIGIIGFSLTALITPVTAEGDNKRV